MASAQRKIVPFTRSVPGALGLTRRTLRLVAGAQRLVPELSGWFPELTVGCRTSPSSGTFGETISRPEACDRLGFEPPGLDLCEERLPRSGTELQDRAGAVLLGVADPDRPPHGGDLDAAASAVAVAGLAPAEVCVVIHRGDPLMDRVVRWLLW